MSKKNKKDRQCSNCGIRKSQHFFGRMDRRCPDPEDEDRPREILSEPSTSTEVEPMPSEVIDQEDPLLFVEIPEPDEPKFPPSPPPGFEKVEVHYWEAVSEKHMKRPAVNQHTGIYAYHADDCMCGLAGWACCEDGIWSCCGETEKYCMCTESKK